MDAFEGDSDLHEGEQCWFAPLWSEEAEAKWLSVVLHTEGNGRKRISRREV